MLAAGVIVVDEGAAPRPDGHQAGGLEIAERLADRRLARPELAGELKFDQPLAGLIVAVQDTLEEHVADADADRLMLADRRRPFRRHHCIHRQFPSLGDGAWLAPIARPGKPRRATRRPFPRDLTGVRDVASEPDTRRLTGDYR